MKNFSNKTRAIAFIVSGAAMGLFALLGATWSNPVLADGTNNVQPLVAPSETAPAVEAAGAPCDSASILLNDTLGKVIASAVVVPSPTDDICLFLQVVPETNATFPVTFPEFQIPATGLFGAGSLDIAAAPGGYSRITDAAHFAGPIGANKVRVCFTLPANASSFKTTRIAYYDTNPQINRWVFLTTATNVAGTQACMTKGLYKTNVVFGLFGQK